MKNIVILLILFIFLSPAYAETVYKWVDEKGVMSFTDDYSKVPPKHRDRAESKVVEERAAVKEVSVPFQADSQKGQDVNVDIYGRDETWWKERVRPWREQLKGAVTNYEKAQKKFVKSAEELSETRFGSRTQVKMDIIRLDMLKGEVMKYEAQIAEARGMLERISEEARESRADPEWIGSRLTDLCLSLPEA